MSKNPKTDFISNKESRKSKEIKEISMIKDKRKVSINKSNKFKEVDTLNKTNISDNRTKTATTNKTLNKVPIKIIQIITTTNKINSSTMFPIQRN